MSAFINTVDSVGDAALTDSIIDRSITELNDNISTSIGEHALRDCSALANVNFPSVTSVAVAAFWECKALKKADFASCVAFVSNAFYGCSALEALILRNAEQISTISGTPFANSAIVSGTGYIYVPAALVDTYKADSSWSTYADQIRAIEDYPLICDPYTWDTVFKCIEDGTYADVYKVGDLVPLEIEGIGAVNMEIVALDADDLTDGSGKAPITWISKNAITTHVINSKGGNANGWAACNMRSWMRDTVTTWLPESIQAAIREVTKTYYDYTTQSTLSIADTVWIPSMRELYGDKGTETSGPDYTAVFSSSDKRIRYNLSGTAVPWWFRTASGNSSSYFMYVKNSGTYTAAGVSLNYGVVLGFCT